ncbi:MAG: hypothetical protein IKM31_01815, partial [Oscillospiraceae bacterium]|nr:hypothetical protein [Oscillospiraceae bacterium]
RKTDIGWRNSTRAFDRTGTEVGHYDKDHLTPGEVTKRRLDSGYSFEFTEPTILVIDGIRYGFLTCYDFYFYEAFAKLARYAPDIIIGCSHQRSDTHQALEMMTRFCAYNTNAYVVRSSVSMDVHSDIGGGSMIVSPKGEMLVNMYSEIGMTCADIDPRAKYYKPGGFGNPLMAHYEYVEQGRRPWKYRPGCSAIVRHDDVMEYPRICAHRGFSTVAPENSMPAFGAAVALGAEEIEFDLWPTADGVIVSTHDDRLERVSDGEGFVYEKTFAELSKLDFGVKFGEKFKGLRVLTFEEILKKFACHTVMNIHLKTVNNKVRWKDEDLLTVISLIRKYDCEKYIYFMSGNDFLLEQIHELAPGLKRCVGGGDAPREMVERAIRMGCEKIQLFKPHFDQAMIDRAHEHGIICNVFWSDDPVEAKAFLDMGIDVILTNDYLAVSQILK